jgi:hypothetical protein
MLCAGQSAEIGVFARVVKGSSSPADRVVAADGSVHTLGDLAQNRVARGMAVRVVDLLEGIDIGKNNAPRSDALRRLRSREFPVYASGFAA